MSLNLILFIKFHVNKIHPANEPQVQKIFTEHLILVHMFNELCKRKLIFYEELRSSPS